MIKTTIVISDEGILTLPDDMLNELGWKEGDVLEWIDNKDGSFMLKKPADIVDEKDMHREYNLREAEYYDKRAKLDLQQQNDLRNWGTK